MGSKMGRKMKALGYSVVAMSVVLAGTAFAQTGDIPRVSGDGTALVQGYSAGPRQHDPEVEVAFWESVKDSGDPMLFLAYLEEFPDGAFRVIARNRLEDLWDRAIRAFALLDEMGVSLDDVPGAVVTPAPPPIVTPAPAPVVVNPPVIVNPTPKPAPEVPSWQLIRNTQSQLAKHGCYKGAIDGVWGDVSRAAMKRFNRKAGTSFSVLRPKSKTVNYMRDLTKSGIQVCR